MPIEPVRAGIVAMAMVAPVAAAGAASIEVQHQPLACVVADRFVRIAAKASPAPRSAELQFRSDPHGAWYALAMTAENGEWTAVLPRPMPSLSGFEYRITMVGEGSETSQTPAYAVKLGADPTTCGGAALSAVSTSIAVRVPYGAPVVPPVPRGFNPSGVTGTQEPEPDESKKAILMGGAAAVAGGVAALALGGGTETGPDLPDFSLDGTVPAPGSTVSLSRDTIQVLLRMSREPAQPLTLDWRAEWRLAFNGLVCVMMSGSFNGAQRPTGLVLTAPLVVPGICGPVPYEARFFRIVVTVGGHVAFSHTGDLPFLFDS